MNISPSLIDVSFFDSQCLHCVSISGGLGVVWSVLWLFLIFDTPAKHPRIDPKEREYIEKSQGLLASVAVSSIWSLLCVTQYKVTHHRIIVEYYLQKLNKTGFEWKRSVLSIIYLNLNRTSTNNKIKEKMRENLVKL